MLIDAREIPAGKTLQTDVCIIGAGAAGLTLAREFINGGTSVGLLESGGFEFSEKTQALYKGQGRGTLPFANDRYVQWSRLRFFGGTTNHWAGWCRPLDGIDFTQRSWVSHSGWPFPLAELEPYYIRAAAVCQVRPVERSLQRWKGTNRAPLEFGPDATIETKLFHFSPPTRFGQSYRREILEAANIDTYIHANVLDLRTNLAGTAVEELEAASLRGNRFRLRARVFVLAAGGVENPRLLLLSRDVHREGLGNQHGLVGRFFADHPHFHAGMAVFTAPVPPMNLYVDDTVDPLLGHQGLGVLCLRETTQRRQQLLNLSLELFPATRDKVTEFAQDLGQTASMIDAGFQPQGDQEYPYLVDLHARTEITPNPESRVVLTDEVDGLGKNRVLVDWRLQPEDSERVKRSLHLLGRELGRLSRGRIWIRITDTEPWPDAVGGEHHMGTTRMHDDPGQGVVDADTRVHGIHNLFVGGSSVFPTYGFANPTLTIVALALRLADHLKRGLPS